MAIGVVLVYYFLGEVSVGGCEKDGAVGRPTALAVCLRD